MAFILVLDLQNFWILLGHLFSSSWLDAAVEVHQRVRKEIELSMIWIPCSGNSNRKVRSKKLKKLESQKSRVDPSKAASGTSISSSIV